MPLIETVKGSFWIEDNRHDANTPVMLMIHGAGGSHLHYPATMRQMPEANAVVPDLSGHGDSHGDGHTTIADYAADIIALLDALHIDSAIIAGHSMGGAIALTLALDYPQRVRGLILLSTGAKLSVHPDILNGVLSEFMQTARTLMDWQWHPHTDQDLREVIGYKTLIGTPAHIVYGDYAACNVFDVRTRLAEIKVPTLIIGGTLDKLTPSRYSEYLHEHIAGSTLSLIEAGAHMVVQEQPKAVAAAIHTWLSQIS
jgi:pimeloyl-ACP methyl ester carboxylesterase